MKLPRYSATVPPPSSSGLARAQNIGALTQTSEQAKWSGVGAFGRTLGFAGDLAFRASQHRQALDDDVESGLFSQKSQERISLGLEEIKNFDWNSNMPPPGSPEEYQILETYNIEERDKYGDEVYGGVAEDIEKLIASIKSPRVKAEKEKWWFENQVNERDKFRHANALNQEDWVKTKMTRMAETAYKNGDVETGDLWFDNMDKHNLISSRYSKTQKKAGGIIADTSLTRLGAQAVMATRGYQEAIEFVMKQDVDVAVRDKVLSDLATQERIRSTRHNQAREETNRQMLANYWDGKPLGPPGVSNEQAVTDAFRAGYLDDTDAKYLRDAIKNPDPPETTNEALIAVRYAIDGIAEGTETRESALKKLIAHTEQLSPTDGKAFIKEIFGEHDTKNAFWNRQAHEYMEKQIMEVATMTGILYGSGEQLALSAQSLMAYDEAKKSATVDGKPLNGRELLELAHEVMMPFRNQVKPLLEGEKLPERLIPKKVGKPRRNLTAYVDETGRRLFLTPDELSKAKLEKDALWEPKFEMTENIPSIIYDDKGKEVGLKRTGGQVFKIGDLMIRQGFTYKYLGKQQWQKQ